MSNSSIDWNALGAALSGNTGNGVLPVPSAVGTRVNEVSKDLLRMKTIQAEQVAAEKANKNSWVSKLNLDPENAAGSIVNLGANLASGTARVGGQLAALPAYIGASQDSAQLTDRHYEAYARNLKGQATQEDLLYLNSKTHQDDRKDNPTILQSIQSAENKRQLGRDITNRFDISDVVQNEKKGQLAQDIGSGFDQPWAQVKEGWDGLKKGEDGQGWSNVAAGLGKLLVNAGDAVVNNKMGALEYVVENIPQLALGAAGKTGMAALTTSNVGYAANEYQKGIEKFQKENGGAMPNAEKRQEMATYAASLALAEQLGDVSLLKGIGKIAGTSDDAVKQGFKQALKGYATEITKATGTEALTEGWQTFAEGKANLEEVTAKDIYTGAVIGGVAGGGMTAIAPVIAAAGVIKEGQAQYKELQQEARNRLNEEAKNSAVVEEAKRTGNVEVFLNKEDKANYDPAKAMDVLFQQDTKDFTPEQLQTHREKVRSVITSFERDIAVQEKALQGNSPELQTQLDEFKAELTQNPQDTELQELVGLLEEKTKAAAPSPEEVAAGEARIAELQPKLEQARAVYASMLDTRLNELTESVNVADTIKALETGSVDSQTTQASVDKIRILSMVSPGAVTVDQAKALVKSGKLSEQDTAFFSLYINAETSIDKLKTMGKVAQEVLEGDPALNQKGLLTYRTRVAQYLADGNQMLANRELRGLYAFRESHANKLTALQEAMQESARTGSRLRVFKDNTGAWQAQPVPPGTNSINRAKGEYVIDSAKSGKLVSGVATELKAMDDTVASLEALQTAPKTTNPGSTNVLVPSPTNQITPATPGTVEASPASVSTTGVGTTQVPAAAAQITDNTTDSASEPSTQLKPVKDSNELIDTASIKEPDLEKAGGFVMPLEWLAEGGDEAQSPWLFSDGRVIGTGQDHIAFADGLTGAQTYTEFMKQTGAIRAGMFIDPVENAYVITLHVTEGQKLTENQKATLEFLQSKQTKPIKVLYGETDTNRNPEYKEITLDELLEKSKEPEAAAVATPDQEAATPAAAGTVDAKIDEGVSTEGSAEQSVETARVTTESTAEVKAEAKPETGKLSIFEDTHPHTEIIRKSLTQKAGKDNGTQRPLAAVKDFLSALVSDASVATQYLPAAPNEKQATTLQFFAEKAQTWSPLLQQLLKKSASPDYKENWDKENHWKNPTEYFVTSNPDDRTELDLDENMKTAVLAAAMTWVADFYGQGLFNKDKSINSILSRDSDEYVSRRERALLGSVGVRRATAANAIGKRAVQALGFKATADAPQDLLAKLEASLGGYALALLVKEGVLDPTTVSAKVWTELTGNRDAKDQLFIRLARTKGNDKKLAFKAQEIVDALRGSQNVLEKLFDAQDGVTVPTFEAVDYAQDKVQKGKTAVPAKLAEVLQKKNSEPNFLKLGMYEILSALSPEMFLKIAGAKDVNDNMHINNRKSQEATNDGLERDYWNIRDFVETVWSEHGQQLPIFLQHVAWKNQRVGIDNTVLNPQTSKMARHLLVRESWKTQVDPNNEEQLNNFKLRVLEGFGIKTDKQDNTKSLKDWKEKTEDARVKAAVAALVHLRQNPGAELSTEQQQAIVDAVEFAKEEMKSLDALKALVDLQVANGQPFESDLVGEVDGVTNGPMLTNLLMGAAGVADKLFDMLNKGGFFQIDSPFKNYNVYRGSDNAMDLYEGVTSAVMAWVRPLAKTPAFEAIWTFTGQMETADGKVAKAGRNIIKRPITALHFGSAMGKAVDGMADDFVDSVFKTIEKYHEEGRDVAPLIRHLNKMMGLPNRVQQAIPENLDSADLLQVEFRDWHINQLKEHFTKAMGPPTKKVLKTQFAKVLGRKEVVNSSANLAFGMFNAVYQAVRKEVLDELVAKGEMPVDGAGKPKWDLSARQEAEVLKRVGKLRPIMATAMSQASGQLAAGLSVSKTEQRLNAEKEVRVLLNKAATKDGNANMSVNPQMLVESEPGVAPFSVSIHSFDSAVSHMAAMLSEALNIHDAHVTGLGNYTQVAQNLNKALWDMALAYSPAQAVYESLERTTNEMVSLLEDPKTSDAVRSAVKGYLQAAMDEFNTKAVKYKKPPFYGTPVEFLAWRLEEAKTTAFKADQVRLGVLAQMAFIDQYALEGGEYTVTDKDRAEAQAKLEALSEGVPADLMEKVVSIDKLLGTVAAQDAGSVDIFEDPRPNIQQTLGMSNAEASRVIEQVLQSQDMPESLKDMLTLVQNTMQALDVTLGEAAAIELDSNDAASLVEYLGAVQQNTGSTAFGVLGTPAIEPESDVVAMMEANPDMSGKEAVRALWSLLNKRTDTPQKAFYGKLLQMTLKALGDDVKVKYVTPQTAPDEVLASPATESRGWYVANNGTIYILSPEFAASGLTAEVLMHELVHAALEELVENPKTAQQKQAVEELKDLQAKAQEYVQANNLSQYAPAVGDVQELLAWGMSNEAFQRDVLNKIQLPETTRSNRVVKGLKRFVNSLVKLLLGDAAVKEKGMVNGLASLLGNATALYKGAAKNQEAKTQAGIEKTNKVYSQATVNPVQQVAEYTTEQVFEALDGTGNSQAFTEKLQGVLADVVNHLHGPFGAIKASMVQRVGSTALDAWANAMARGERPFHGKTVNARVQMSAREAFVSEQVEAVMGEVLADKGAANSMIYRELEKVYVQARDQMKGKMDADLYNFVFRPQKDQGDKSDYMQRFIALAMSNEQFNNALAFETRKPALSFKGKTFMERLQTIWRMAVDWISAKMTGTVLGQRADRRVSSLVRKLVQIEARHKDMVLKGKGKSILDFMEPLTDKAKDAVEFGKEKVYNAANSNFVKENSFAIVKGTGAVARIVAGDRVEKVVEGLQAMRNKALKGKHGNAMQLLNFVKGPGQWLNEMARGATFIQNNRKDIANGVTKAVSQAFKDGGAYLDSKAKRVISAYLLRTGAYVLLDKFQAAGIQNLLEDSKALKLAIEEEIGSLSGYAEVAYFVAQAKGLAFKQVTGWAGVRQNLNAHNIAHLYNSGYPSPANVSAAIPAIERLIALYGLQYAKQEDALGVNTLLDVMRTENGRGGENGIEMTLRTYRHLYQDAKERNFNGSESLMRHGYLPEEHNPHVEFVVVRDPQDAVVLKDQGYELYSEIGLDPNDPDKRAATMYVRKGGGLPRWASGAFSTTGTNARGKQKHGQYYNPFDSEGVANTQSMNEIHAAEQAEVDAQLQGRAPEPSRKHNRMIPILNANGMMVDYRYEMKEDLRDELLERNNDFDHLLGVMAGNSYDKEASREQNKVLVQTLHDLYKKEFAKDKNSANFILVGERSEDPELKEMWRLLGSDTKRDVMKQWGMKGMMVPKEMVTPLFGYRKLSLSTMFDKDTRSQPEQLFVDLSEWLVEIYGQMRLETPEQVQRRVARTGVIVRQIEEGTEEIVREIKDTIVIKTVTVLWGNITSNFSVLLMNGLSLKELVMYQKEGLTAVMDYQRDNDELVQLKLKLDTMYGVVDENALKDRIVELEDSIARNPAKELIDAGLLPTIVEDVSMEDNPYAYKSQLGKWVEAKTAKVNPTVVKAARSLYMTHDSTLYKFLNKSTQYSDFVARYALYKHETTRKRQPLSKADALFNASETFVNYDIQLPPVLQYLDDHGLMMFTKYFLSIQRVLARLVRDKPLEVLNTIALNNLLMDAEIITNSAAILRVGNNPLSMGPLGLPGVLDEGAVANTALGLFR